MASSNQRAKWGRVIAAVGGLWILLGFVNVFFVQLEVFDFNPFFGFLLFFIGRSLVKSNRRPMPDTSETTRPSRPTPRPPQRRTPPPAPPVQTTPPAAPPDSEEAPIIEERDQLLERMFLSGSEVADRDTPAPEDGDYKPMTSAEMIAKARQKYNKR